MFKLLRINMLTGSISFEEIKEEYKYFGGRGFVVKLLSEEVDPGVDPLGPDNKLVICNGLLAGTSASSSGRLSVGAKSPLTGTVKEANSGGVAGGMLARLGIKAIVVEGQSEDSWFILKISQDKAELIPADQYTGMNNYALADALKKLYGDKAGIISIGNAGERGYRNATVQVTDTEGRPCRAAARGGLGSVMGSKKLKAIVLETGTTRPDYADKEKFTAAMRGYSSGIQAHPLSGEALPALGTAVLVNIVNAMGALPTRNFQSGNFEDAEKISGENLAKLQSERGGKLNHPCQPGCVIGCSNVYNDADGNYLTAGFEYETIGMNGSNCAISDLDTIARIDRLCDDLGLDTMETGATIAVYMEAGKIPFGNGASALDLVQEMIDGSELGQLLGQGTKIVGEKLGVSRIPTVKGQAIAAYDPRALKGTGVTYATSPMGADHTAGNALGNPTVDPTNKEGQVKLSNNLQVGMATFDNLGMCIFSGFCTEDPANGAHLLNMMAGLYGGEWSPDRLFGIGVQTLMLEKDFNSRAGFTADADKLPSFFYSEALPPSNSVFDLSAEDLAETLKFT